MRVKTQLTLSILIFSIIIAVTAALIFATEGQTSNLNSQVSISRDILSRANNLAYNSGQYFLYQEATGLIEWQTDYSYLSLDLSKVIVSTHEQQTILNNINGDIRRLNSSWATVISYLQNAPRNVSVRVDPVFQTGWSIMTAQNQAVVFDAQQLSQSYVDQVNQSNFSAFGFILILLLAFAAYFIVNYLITYRNTLKSISKLQDGIAKVGSGDLDFQIIAGKKDEIGEITQSVNRMTTNLKTVTASKVDLEKEIVDRRKAEETLASRNVDLERLQLRLEEKAAEVEEYATGMEELAEERAIKLKDAERMAAIGATAGMVGHDIRNPLQAITSDMYIAKQELKDLPDSEQKHTALESITETEKNVEYINKIVQDLQDYARPLNPKIEESDLRSVIEGMIAKNGMPKNIDVEVDVKENAQRIRADTYYINRILTNLVTNAVQAMPDGGKLWIRARKDGQDTILSVKDTGVGIPESIKEKMFTLMFTTKSKGQGFGLPVVKRMAESLGGTITFESQEGKGTTFNVRLPPPKK